MTDDEIEEAICACATSGLRIAAARSRANLAALNIDPADLQEWVSGLTEWPESDLLDAYRAWAEHRPDELRLLTLGSIMSPYKH